MAKRHNLSLEKRAAVVVLNEEGYTQKEIAKQVIRVQKLVGLPPPHSNYLEVFLRFRRTFAEVITFGEALAHAFYPKF